MSSKLKLSPIVFADACAYIENYHRHHKKPQGHKYSISAIQDDKIVGVVMVGRPVARGLQDGKTLEVTRLCTNGTHNACSFLYSAAWRVARNLGYTHLITYILATESGTSLLASGFKFTAHVKGHSWSTPSRPRVDKHPTIDKLRFEIIQE